MLWRRICRRSVSDCKLQGEKWGIGDGSYNSNDLINSSHSSLTTHIRRLGDGFVADPSPNASCKERNKTNITGEPPGLTQKAPYIEQVNYVNSTQAQGFSGSGLNFDLG